MAVDDARDGERGRLASLVPAGGRTLPGLVRRTRKLGEDEKRRLRAYLGAVVDRLVEQAPRLTVRDLATLRAQYPDMGPEQIADRLVAGAVKGTTAVGAGVGAAAMLPTPPTMPAELAAELVGVALVELRLVAELHEVYGQPLPGTPRRRAVAALMAWSQERGVHIANPATLDAAVGDQFRQQLQQPLTKRLLRNLPNLAPLLIGAAVGAAMNRRETRRLADRVRADLRRRQVPWEELDALGREPSREESD